MLKTSAILCYKRIESLVCGTEVPNTSDRNFKQFFNLNANLAKNQVLTNLEKSN